jgi:type II secretory pathway pseudopilin PulG
MKPRRPDQRGMLLLGVLVWMALASWAAVNAGQRWADARQRDAEAELLQVGLAYQRALESYYFHSPPGQRQFPARLEDLLADPRFPMPVRHLRQLYRDPLAPAQPWGLVRQPDQRITGVYSSAPGIPIRSVHADPRLQGFSAAVRYADWRFVARTNTPSTITKPQELPKPATIFFANPK